MKFILISFCISFCFSQNNYGEPIDGVLAVVGENIITQSEFFEQLKLVADRQGISPSASPIKYESLAKDLLSNIVNQLVLLEHAKMDTNIFIGDDEVKKQLDLQVSGFINSMGSVDALENYLNKSLREIKAFYWDEIYNAMLIERFRYSLLSGVSVGKKEVDDFYITYKDSLPPVPKRASFSLLNMKFVPGKTTTKYYYDITKSLLDSLNRQTSFESLVKRHSDDFASIPNGGVVGETERGSFLKEYEEAAFSSKVGDVVGPIKTSAGFHIIKLLDKKGEKITTQHLLKVVQPSLEDKDSLVKLINSFYTNTKEDSLYLFNLLMGENYTRFGFSGNYTDHYYENFPLEVVRMIDSSSEFYLSDPFGFSDGTLGLLCVYNKQGSEKATLNNSYNYIAGLAKEKKAAEFVENWLVSAKKDVYINIFIEN